MTTRKYLNVGSTPNDGRGDTLRDAAEKIEYNFGLLFGNLDVQSANASGNLTNKGLVVINTPSPSTMTLENGDDIGDRKEIVNNNTGTATINGLFQGGTTLTVSPNSACALVWVGSSWALFSDTGISVT